MNLPLQTYSLCEAVADLAFNWGAEDWIPNNSRDVTMFCIQWAEEFERQWTEDFENEYLDEIDKFFNLKYGEWLRDTPVERRHRRE